MTETRDRPYRCACHGETGRIDFVEAPRAELTDTLKRMSVECFLLGKDELSRQASEAATGLEAGSFSVKVGHTVYSVPEKEV